MAAKSNEFLVKCGSCHTQYSEGVLFDDCELWYYWECATAASSLDLGKPWCCVWCEDRLIKEQRKTTLDLGRKLTFGT